ncbi:MAG: 50S ribosomal protein L24 [Candidatus Pacebacteria bacterium]|nr:50S ribosomal protein L24 [Candidatus Paceibacterota bacterium]
MKIHKNDTVLVTKGKYRGKTGKVLKAVPKQNKLIVEGINIVKKHIRPKKTGEKGSVVENPGPIDISNVKFICKKCKKATRVKYKIIENKKSRFCKKCEKEV